jgi:hypothetical protein
VPRVRDGARRPRHWRAERVLDQRRGQPVEDVAPGRRPMTAQASEPMAQLDRRDRIGGRDALTAPAQPGDRGHRHRLRCPDRIVPQRLVERRRRHARGVAGEAVEAEERERDEVAAGAGQLGRRRRDRRPRRGRHPPDHQPLERRLVEAAAHHHDRATTAGVGLGQRPGDAVGHEVLADEIGVARLLLAAQRGEVRPQARAQRRVVARLLEQVIPQRVGRVEAVAVGGVAQRRAHLMIAIAVAVRHGGERRMPAGQIDERDLGAARPPVVERHPLWRVRTQRRPPRLGDDAAAGHRGRIGVVVRKAVAVDRDRELVRQPQLVEARGQVTRTLDQHGHRTLGGDHRAHQPRAGRAVVAHTDDAQPGHGQAGSAWRAA